MADNAGLVYQSFGSGAFADAADGGGVIKCVTDEIELSSLAADSVKPLGRKIQGKIRIVDATLYHDALGTGVTLKLGDEDDDDAIIPATAAATAGKIDLVIGQVFAELTGNQLQITTGGATASGTVKVVVKYVNV